MKKLNVYSLRILFIGILALVFICGTGLTAFCQARGDVNNSGSVDINDALLIARYTAGVPVPGFVVGVADTNCDYIVTITDALIIARYSAGIATYFAVCLPPTLTSTPTSTPTPTPTPTITDCRGCIHLDNPFSGPLKWYVNPLWSANAAASGGAAIANCNTVVWLDRIAAIAPSTGMGLQAHLDECLAQGANIFTMALYNLPHRNCSSSASNGELECDPAGTGIARYKTEYIDPIVTILDNPKYYGIRIIVLFEPDSLPNLVTNISSYYKCNEASNRGCYVQGIQYALNKFYPLTHCYKYLEIGHSAWLGYENNFNPAITLYQNVVRNTTYGVNSIDGFITNVCHYLPLDEPFITDGNMVIGGKQVKTTKFYDYNSMVDELQFADAWYVQMVSMMPGIGMIVDTSRNGWGGPNRPTQPSLSNDVETYVNESRIDRRDRRDNWCNIKIAGLGERPQGAPRPHYDAYIWAKAPGESDGVSGDGIIDPQDPNKKFITMCDPNGINTYCSCGTTDARARMPHIGTWSTEFFQQLLANAYPPL